MSAHTPGPWVYYTGTKSIWSEDQSTAICITFGPRNPTEDESVERHATGHLIAAAPELLKALRELLALAPAVAPASGLIMGIDKRHAAAIKAARAAIAKAGAA